jgi:ectoine hydroxylase-related dioxygenase (phytanoyl-CoA dioxygenase family)
MSAVEFEHSPVAVPPPARDLEEGLRHIRDFGLCIMPEVLTGAALRRTREALYRAADADRARSREQKFGLDYAHDDTNQRVWNVLSRDPVFEDLVEHPAALAFVRAVLGWPTLLGNISANITGPGGGEMVLHADQIFVPEPWPAKPQGLNVTWLLDDFTEANGATRVAPASHRLNRAPRLRAARPCGSHRPGAPGLRCGLHPPGCSRAFGRRAVLSQREDRCFSCPECGLESALILVAFAP